MPPAPTTEAACLLETGRAYPRRLGLRDAGGSVVFVGLHSGGFSVYHDDAPIFHFDLDGRWQRAFVDGVHALKGLDAVVRILERPREDGVTSLRRQTLSYVDATEWDARIRNDAIELATGISHGRWTPVDPPAGVDPIPRGDLLDLLDRVAGWDAAAWFAQRERYAATFGPEPVLPPQLSRLVLLQKTLGDASGQGFAGSPPAPHAVRTPEEFADHARAVRDLLGRRVAQTKTAVVAGSDVVGLPADEVVRTFATARETLQLGLHLLVDPRSAESEPVTEPAFWTRLAAEGLAGITIQTDTDALPSPHLIETAHAAGVAVGLMIAVDLVADDAATTEKVRQVAALPLASCELVTLLDGRTRSPATPTSPLALRSWVQAVRDLSPSSDRSKMVRVVPYNPDRWTD